MKPKTSALWNFFNEVDDNTVRCKLCDHIYSRKGRGTSGLRSHLKSRHVAEFAEYEKQDEELKKAVSDTNKRKDTETPLHLAKRQVTLHEALDKNKYWDITPEKSRELDKFIREMLALQDLPFNFVEGLGFRRFVHAAQPKYNLRGRQFYTSNLCNSIYPKMAEKVKDILNSLHHITFTSDIWTEPGAGVSLLSFTMHGINTDFKRVYVILKCVVLEERHTGDVIAQKIYEMQEEWGISRQKLHVMIRDGGSNMKRAARLAQINNIDCAIHQIQLCIRAALSVDEHISTLLAKCKQIATHFNHSIIAQNELKTFQERLGLPRLCVRVQVCSTRWNSTLFMVQRLIEIKDAIVLYTSQHTNLPQLTPQDWLQLENCVKVLKPFEEATNTMSGAEACISSVIPLIHVLTCRMRDILRDENNDQDSINIITKMTEEINNRFGELHNNNIYAIATYLDPKYMIFFFNEITKERIESELITLICQTENQTQPKCIESNYNEQIAESRPSTSQGRNTHSTNKLLELDSMLANMLASAPNSDDDEGENQGRAPTIDRFFVAKSLLTNYINAKRANVNEDSLLWWKENPQYFQLFGAVRQYLSAPPSSVPSERLFSGAGLIYDELRNRLSGETAAKILFIKYNLPIINFQY